MPPAAESTESRSIRVLHFGGKVESADVQVAAEVAVEFCYGGAPFAVMMATPADLEDFALGFSLSEEVIDHPGDLRAVATEVAEGGLRLSMTLAPEPMHRHLARRRLMQGRTSCGLCGIGDLAALPSAGRRVNGAPIALGAIARAVGGLADRQTLNALTRATHAAAWCDREGGIVLVREDVGRHNALDKAIGACLRAGLAPDNGFFCITSRASFEMVDKAARFGCATLVAVSAPTALAVERAERAGMTLLAVARSDSARLYCGAVAP